MRNRFEATYVNILACVCPVNVSFGVEVIYSYGKK